VTDGLFICTYAAPYAVLLTAYGLGYAFLPGFRHSLTGGFAVLSIWILISYYFAVPLTAVYFGGVLDSWNLALAYCGVCAGLGMAVWLRSRAIDVVWRRISALMVAVAAFIALTILKGLLLPTIFGWASGQMR